MRIAIDATNVGGGGGVTHLKELMLNLSEYIEESSIERVQIISSSKVLDALPSHEKFYKTTHKLLNKGLLHRLFFQVFLFKSVLKGSSVMLSVTGDYFGSFRPFIAMSRNMLFYRKDIWEDQLMNFSERLRFKIGRQRQKLSFRKSCGIIFISRHAETCIIQDLKLGHKISSVIHHGVSRRFEFEPKEQRDISTYTELNPFKLIYVSSVHVYKHQWNVIDAVHQLRNTGYPISLDLIGTIIYQKAGEKMKEALNRTRENKAFIRYLNEVPYEKLANHYKEADGIIFASTCENMPNTLIESMSSGRPIACSNYDPMPEFIEDNTFYFDPTNISSIYSSIEKMLKMTEDRKDFVRNNKELVKKYTWKSTTKKTIEFLTNFN